MQKILLVLAVVGILLRAPLLFTNSRVTQCGADFPVFYAGGRLATSPQLYSPEAVQDLQRRETGCTSPSAIFIRLPYFAGAFWPLSRLSIYTASWIWLCLGIAAIAGFIWLWPNNRLGTLAACAWSLALSWDLTMGQDVAFLLLWIALAVWLLDRGHEFSAGLVFSLCAAKPHFFLLLPVLLLLRRRSAFQGFLLGAGILLVSSFLLQGPDWPSRFLRAALDSRIDPHPESLQNVRGLVGGSLPMEIASSLLVAAAALYVCWKGEFLYGLASAILAGLAMGHHLAGSDPALLIPAALLLTKTRFQAVAILCITPMAWLLAVPFPHVTGAIPLLLLAFFGYETWNRSDQRNPAAQQTAA
jgi:hypothetical protein